MNIDTLKINKQSWDAVANRFYGRNPLPEYGPMAPSEDDLNLFGDVSHLKVLDIGCGSGHSLQYMLTRNVAETWGIDLSKKQIEAASELLKDSGQVANLFEAPMEEDPGLPQNYFDIVYSIYALGWTTDLHKTIENVHRYLKKDGVFIFSWEHPLHSRVRYENDMLTMHKSYHEEGPYDHEAWDHPAIMQQYRLSTYLNILIEKGFKIERVVEDVCLSEEDTKRHANRWYSTEKATFIPTTMIIKSRKL
jgi:SAM-dependent methyltransferase